MFQAQAIDSLDLPQLQPYRTMRRQMEHRQQGIFVAEGEKDADRLVSLGFVATCNPGGAGKWQSDYAEFFRGRDVAVLPDNDTAGHDHARSVAANLAPGAARVRILDLPDLPPKGDVSDWLDDGGTCEALERLVADAPVFSFGRRRGDRG